MTLEDFFTLTEMRDGLSTRGRVEELVSVMQQQKYCITGDAVRQWSAVAMTLAVTENKECLKHFVQLSGLCFFDQWLQEAQKCNGVNDDITEELIEALLTSIRRLPVEAENYHYSEIMKTIEKLLDHKSLNIRHRAMSLLDNWSQPSGNGELQSAQNESCEIILSEHLNISVLVQCDQRNAQKGYDENSARTEFECTDAARIDSTNGAKVPSACQTKVPNLISQENISLHEEPLCPSTGMTSSNTGSTNGRKRRDAGGTHDVAISKDADHGVEREIDEEVDDTCQSNVNDVYDNTSHTFSAMDSNPLRNVDSKQNGSSILESSPTLHKSESFECGTPTYARTNKLDTFSNVSGDFKDFHGNATSIVENMDVSETYSREVAGSDSVNVDADSDDDETRGPEFSYPGGSPRAGESSKAEKADDSALELDEEFDPLAVAYQVAIEVEREVFDYREPFCSSPEVNSSESTGAFSHDSNGKQIALENNEQKGEVTQIDGDFTDHASLKQDPSIFEQVVQEGCEPDIESQMVSLVAEGAKKRFENCDCSFDLNEDPVAEEFQCPTYPVNLSLPKVVVAVSRGAPPSLQFEGEFGFKGCAATSAFRPASLVIIDVEKTCSSASKPNVHLFDLNIAEIEDEIAVEPTGLPSGDSSLEINSKGVKRAKLDLNKVEDEDMPTYPITYLTDLQNGGDQCLSPTSSSSSRQPFVRYFDLNDNPSLVDCGSFHNSSSLTYQSSGIPGNGSSKVEVGVFTFMGSPIDVEGRDYSDQAEHPLMGSGPCFNPGLVFGPPRMPYSHVMPPSYAYNGYVTAPPMSIHPAVYGSGSMPDMVDARGAPMVPQVLGPPNVGSIPSLRPAYIMGSYASSSNFQLVRPPYPGADMNYAMGMDGGGFFFLNEQPANRLQPSTSTMGLKRKEPDSGWESSYPFGYKEVTSWQ